MGDMRLGESVVTFVDTHATISGAAATDRLHRLDVFEWHRFSQQLVFITVDDVLYEVRRSGVHVIYPFLG